MGSHSSRKGVLVHLDFDDSSDDAVDLAPNHKAARMPLNGDCSLVHDVCAHGVKHCHLPPSQEHLCTSWHAHMFYWLVPTADQLFQQRTAALRPKVFDACL